jgi:pseudouridine-5'-phosphate glycosidase
MNKYFELSPLVIEALEKNLPIVALESTIISHGMPYPGNVETAIRCEEIIMENGSVPATIAILNGKLKVGLSTVELEYLGQKGPKIVKTSRRDIAYNVSQRIDGATTVSATMFIAGRAGIKVFATGGIGGVHRGAESTFDISADLEELSITNVAVVCSGIKSILDLGLSLEYLETKGVPVLGYQTEILPAFYSRDSAFNVNFKVDSPQQIAGIIKTKFDLGMRGGMLITNPIPEEHSLDAEFINRAINSALAEMEKMNIRGKEQTPYLLAKIAELTNGKSLESNIALVYNNCKLASEISASYNDLK